MVQLTERDEAMLEWLRVVRMADLDAIRWTMGAFSDSDDREPVSLRNAQRWMHRMHQIGFIGTARHGFHPGSIIWPTHDVGLRAPNLLRQTTRHELTVAAVSARYLVAGYQWERDRRPEYLLDHQADGVATKDGQVELIEVELTPKTRDRYRIILTSHSRRLETGIDRVVYYCTPAAARTVAQEADRNLFRDTRPQLTAVPAIDAKGQLHFEKIQIGADRNIVGATRKPGDPDQALQPARGVAGWSEGEVAARVWPAAP